MPRYAQNQKLGGRRSGEENLRSQVQKTKFQNSNLKLSFFLNASIFQMPFSKMVAYLRSQPTTHKLPALDIRSKKLCQNDAYGLLKSER